MGLFFFSGPQRVDKYCFKKRERIPCSSVLLVMEFCRILQLNLEHKEGIFEDLFQVPHSIDKAIEDLRT